MSCLYEFQGNLGRTTEHGLFTVRHKLSFMPLPSTHVSDKFQPVTLTGRNVQLTPLSIDHREGLAAAVQDGDLWELWYTNIPSPEGMLAEIHRRLAWQEAGSMLPFAIIDKATGQIVGMTTYMNI